MDQFKNLKFFNISIPKHFLILINVAQKLSFGVSGSCGLNKHEHTIVKNEKPDRTNLLKVIKINF